MTDGDCGIRAVLEKAAGSSGSDNLTQEGRLRSLGSLTVVKEEKASETFL